MNENSKLGRLGSSECSKSEVKHEMAELSIESDRGGSWTYFDFEGGGQSLHGLERVLESTIRQ